MRRLFFCLIMVFSLLIPGCASASFTPSSNTALPSFPPASSRPNIVRVQLPDSLLQDLLAEHDLAYPDPFSQEYPNILTVPVMVHYSADYLYYCSFEETPFIGEKYPMTVPEEIHEGLYKYNLSSCEKVKVGDVSLSGYSSGQFLFTDDAYYISSVTLEQGNSTLCIKGLDFESGQIKEIAQIENGNLYVLSSQTDSGACAFLVRIADDEQISQKLYTLNAGRELTVIYDSAKIGLASPEFTALCAGNDSLFLLKQTDQTGQLVTEIVEMDLKGAILRTISLPGLQEYSDPEYYADKLYVAGDYIFIKWYYCGEHLPYFSAFKLEDGKASKVNVPDNNPCYLLNAKPIDNRYFLFSAFPDGLDYVTNTYTSHLYVLDAQDDCFTGISLPLAEDVVFNDMICNEYGDIIMNIVEKSDPKSAPQKRTLRIAFDDLKSLL